MQQLLQEPGAPPAEGVHPDACSRRTFSEHIHHILSKNPSRETGLLSTCAIATLRLLELPHLYQDLSARGMLGPEGRQGCADTRIGREIVSAGGPMANDGSNACGLGKDVQDVQVNSWRSCLAKGLVCTASRPNNLVLPLLDSLQIQVARGLILPSRRIHSTENADSFHSQRGFYQQTGIHSTATADSC